MLFSCFIHDLKKIFEDLDINVSHFSEINDVKKDRLV